MPQRIAIPEPSSLSGLILRNALAVTVGLLSRSRLVRTNLVVEGPDHFGMGDKPPESLIKFPQRCIWTLYMYTVFDIYLLLRGI
jgi:hypothetical protein